MAFLELENISKRFRQVTAVEQIHLSVERGEFLTLLGPSGCGKTTILMTAIYVTHDQEEALAISDRIAVMAKGKIEQLDRPEEIYVNPHTVFAATFVGTSNQFQSVVESSNEGLCQAGSYTLHVMPIANLQKGSRVLVLVRPEEVTLQPSDSVENANGTDNRIAGFIELRTFLGPFTRFHIKVNGDMTLTADIPSQQARGYFVGQNVVLSFPREACQVLALDEAEVELSKQAQAEAV